ncbi:MULTISPECIES: Rpn family recombination-promoting nuclease/putative transposase [Lachnospiraceae]|uniref:Rpn family recombination-promoting nuclease/putative transposase n=1 Tax=Lachnospiraceae TaxID=186803 RepID=UPI001F2674B2|nr:Rpn family recombination-promoting nuclease/putative transposase [Faecalicatena contorta]MCF2669440.1 Rpn family recombination-promoting nuclease/putative transposase [Faecalicatena contorta]
MKRKKQLKELTLKDNFMFGAVMMEEENCKRFLELALGFPIERVEVSKEKSIVYHPEYKGVRLDVYAKNEHNTRYNVEMQVAKKAELGKRVRYYHGQIDMELLLSGSDYTELPEVYVIFICDFDPFGKKKYRYTFTKQCEEEPGAQLQDGCKSIFLSTRGENDREVPGELVSFLNFVKADLSESETDFEDDFVEKLQNTIRRIKSNREMEERFMIFEEMLRDERAEGKAEGIAEGKAEGIAEGKTEAVLEMLLELMNDLGEIPDELRNRITSEKDLETLKKWHRLAARSESLDEFLKKM